MDSKNLAILAKLKEQLLAEENVVIEQEPVEQIVRYPFKPSKSNVVEQAPVKQIVRYPFKSSQSRKKARKQQPNEIYPHVHISFSFVDGGDSSEFRAQNRKMVSQKDNIGRNHASDSPQEIHTFHGGMARPK